MPAEAPVAPADRPSRNELLTVGLLALVPTLVKLAFYANYPGSDDAFIHLTIIRNVTHGLGWGINPGEPVNLSSSPLYTILVSLCSLLGLNALGAGMVLSGLAGIGAMLALHRLLLALGLRPLARVAGVAFAAFNLYLWRWNAVVMETTLSVCLLTVAYWCYHLADAEERPPVWRHLLTGVLVGLAVLTRFELGLALGCFGLREMLVYRRPARFLRTWVLMTVAFAATVLPWFLFCRRYFGLMLPTTFYEKTSAGLIWWNRQVGEELIKLVISSELVPLLAVGALLAAALWRRSATGFGRTLVTRLDVYLFPLLLALFYYLKTPNLQSAARYYLPGLQLIAALLACTLDALESGVPVAWLRPGMTAVVAGHALLSLGINQVRVVPVLSRFKTNYWTVAEDAAKYLKSRSRPDHNATVLVEVDIGMLSYYSDGQCYFYDGGALATPSLHLLTVQQQVDRTHPDLVIETLGSKSGRLVDGVTNLKPVWSREFRSHSVTDPRTLYECTIYEVGR